MSISYQKIDAVLPQTQCKECGYDACEPYAKALAAGTEQRTNLCRPGGLIVSQKIAQLLETHESAPKQEPWPIRRAFIQTEQCIGCTLCLTACPVDAIFGASKLQHQILEEACTGCGLCLSICPTSCIDLIDRTLEEPSRLYNKQRYLKRTQRLEQKRVAKFYAHKKGIAKLRHPKELVSLCIQKAQEKKHDD